MCKTPTCFLSCCLCPNSGSLTECSMFLSVNFGDHSGINPVLKLDLQKSFSLETGMTKIPKWALCQLMCSVFKLPLRLLPVLKLASQFWNWMPKSKTGSMLNEMRCLITTSKKHSTWLLSSISLPWSKMSLKLSPSIEMTTSAHLVIFAIPVLKLDDFAGLFINWTGWNVASIIHNLIQADFKIICLWSLVSKYKVCYSLLIII